MKESQYNIWVERDAFHYLYNGKSGALLRLDGDDRESVRRYLEDRDSPCSARVLESMVRGQMLVPDDIDEVERLAAHYARSRFDNRTLALTLVTSLGCNFDCPYCFEDKHPSVMNGSVQASLLKLIDNRIADIQTLVVTWFGGEPLVGKKPLLRLSEAFIERCERSAVRYQASIITNGYFLDEDTCRPWRRRRSPSRRSPSTDRRRSMTACAHSSTARAHSRKS